MTDEWSLVSPHWAKALLPLSSKTHQPGRFRLPSLQTMLMRPWILGIAAQDRVIQNPIQSLCTRGVASSSVHANAAVNRDFDPRGGVNKRGRWDECARWGRLGDVPYRSALSLHNVTWWSRRWKGNVQSVPRSLCPVHSLAPPQALNPRNAVR